MLLEDLFVWMHYDSKREKNKEAGLFIAKRLRELADNPNSNNETGEPSADFQSRTATSSPFR